MSKYSNMNEQDLYKEYYDTTDKLNELSVAVGNHVLPFVKKALENDDPKLAILIVKNCPDVVIRAYAFDAINEYKKEAQK